MILTFKKYFSLIIFISFLFGRAIICQQFPDNINCKDGIKDKVILVFQEDDETLFTSIFNELCDQSDDRASSNNKTRFKQINFKTVEIPFEYSISEKQSIIMDTVSLEILNLQNTMYAEILYLFTSYEYEESQFEFKQKIIELSLSLQYESQMKNIYVTVENIADTYSGLYERIKLEWLGSNIKSEYQETIIIELSNEYMYIAQSSLDSKSMTSSDTCKHFSSLFIDQVHFSVDQLDLLIELDERCSNSHNTEEDKTDAKTYQNYVEGKYNRCSQYAYDLVKQEMNGIQNLITNKTNIMIEFSILQSDYYQYDSFSLLVDAISNVIIDSNSQAEFNFIISLQPNIGEGFLSLRELKCS